MDLPGLDDYLMGREKLYPLTPLLMENAEKTLRAVQDLLISFGQYRRISSGYRPKEINSHVREAKPGSHHITCQAADLEDIDGKLNQFCKLNPETLKNLGLYCEERRGGWQHVQIVPPPSGKRWFFP
jgi:hypothetical protein